MEEQIIWSVIVVQKNEVLVSGESIPEYAGPDRPYAFSFAPKVIGEQVVITGYLNKNKVAMYVKESGKDTRLVFNGLTTLEETIRQRETEMAELRQRKASLESHNVL